MTDRIRIVRHEAVPKTGSFEVRWMVDRAGTFTSMTYRAVACRISDPRLLQRLLASEDVRPQAVRR